MNLGGRDYSELRSCHCTLAWATEQDSVSKNKQTMNGGKKLDTQSIDKSFKENGYKRKV